MDERKKKEKWRIGEISPRFLPLFAHKQIKYNVFSVTFIGASFAVAAYKL